MAVLTIAVTLVILLTAAWVVARGLIWVERVLRWPSGDAVQPGFSVLRDIASIIIVGLGGLLVGTLLVAAALVAQEEVQLTPMHSSLIRVENRIHYVYESTLDRLESGL